MSLILQWLESLGDKIEINDQCLREISPFSKCDLCIQVCDENALTIEGGKIVVDERLCTACGKCMTTCPSFAIEGLVPTREVIKNTLIYNKKNKAPSLREWLYYYHKGVRKIAIINNELSEKWSDSLTEANLYLEKMELPLIKITDEIPQREEQGYTRRQLFQQLTEESKSVVMKSLTPAKWRFNNAAFSLNRAFPEWSFYEVTIDEEQCNLCEICFKICPQKVFTIDENEVTIDQSKCTGCTLCIDVCKENAITFEHIIQPARLDTLTVFENKCPSCRNTTKQWQEEPEKCFVCKNRTKLF